MNSSSAPAPLSTSPGAPLGRGVGARVGIVESLGLVARDIKLAHSVFAMPFAVLGAVLAGWGRLDKRSFVIAMALVVACMVLARTWAMLFNRLVDRDFDAANARTQRRVFASGALSLSRGWGIAVGVAALFVVATAGFWLWLGNPWPLRLGVPVLAWIAFYSLTKRFTWLCHVFLGSALAASPVAAALALRPEAVIDTPTIWWLAGMVMVWVAGFDVIYALQDVAFDRERGLFSVPARLGVAAAIWISRGLHAVAFMMLVLAWRSDTRLGWSFAGAVGLVGALLIAEHVVLARRGERGLDMAFFTLNGVVSCVVGLVGCADVMIA